MHHSYRKIRSPTPPNQIADFGASKRLQSATLGTAGEGDWSLKGTPYYMAPEQVNFIFFSLNIGNGLPAIKLGPSIIHQMRQEECGRRADVWALGGVTLFMATTQVPLLPVSYPPLARL